MAKPFTPILTATPTSPPSYNPGMADTFSWVPVQGADRNLFARSVYLVNPEEIVTSNISVGSEIVTLNANLTAFVNQEALSNSVQIDQLTAFKQQQYTNGINLYKQLTALSDQLDVDATTIIDQLSNLSNESLYKQLTALSLQVDEDCTTIINQLTTLNQKIDYLVDKADAQLGQKGFDFIESGSVQTGNWTTITVISASKFIDIGGPNINLGNLVNYFLPITFTFSGPITSIHLEHGSVIAYR